MFPIRPETDPIVEILCLAYRRGLAILQERESKLMQEASQSTSTDKEEPTKDPTGSASDEISGGTS